LCLAIVSGHLAALSRCSFLPEARGFLLISAYQRVRTCGRAALMHINIWIVLAVLLALLAITRLSQYQHETQRICADNPSATVCGR
jgi:hypothetical protein